MKNFTPLKIVGIWFLDRLRAAAFQAAAWVYSWLVALYISSTDYTRPSGYLYLIDTGFLPIPMHPHCNFPRHMCTITHIPIVHARKGIFPHCNHSTICSHFPIIQLQSTSIEYLPSTGKPLISFSPSSPPLHHHVFRRITCCNHCTRFVSSCTGRYHQCSSSDCWMVSQPCIVNKRTPLVTHKMESNPTHLPGTRTYTCIAL